MDIKLSEISKQLARDTGGFIGRCEVSLTENIKKAARFIADNSERAHIILLSGPSASGKTTTATRIAGEIGRLGIQSHRVSMDDYFKTVGPDAPVTETGERDLESPLCLDIPLLLDHMSTLAGYGEVMVPTFDFINQRRAGVNHPLKLNRGEVVIFEGIHALNNLIAAPMKGRAKKIVVRVSRNFTDDNGTMAFPKNLVRLVRRVIRDARVRGMDASFTIHSWKNIHLGDMKYIHPYIKYADMQVDTTLPYELHANKQAFYAAVDAAGGELAELHLVRELRSVLDGLQPAANELIPDDSILREFIGGSIYENTDSMYNG